MKQATFAYVNHAKICSWNQTVLGNEGKAFDGARTPTQPITSWMLYPLCHAAIHNWLLNCWNHHDLHSEFGPAIAFSHCQIKIVV